MRRENNYNHPPMPSSRHPCIGTSPCNPYCAQSIDTEHTLPVHTTRHQSPSTTRQSPTISFHYPPATITVHSTSSPSAERFLPPCHRTRRRPRPMPPQLPTRHPPHLMSVANLVRDRDSDPSPMLAAVSGAALPRVSCAPASLWGPSTRLAEPPRSISATRVRPSRCDERRSFEKARAVVDDDMAPVWRGSPPRADARCAEVAIDVKRYAKLLTPFIYKLYCLVTDECTNGLCEWANGGNAFIVHQPTAFSADVLPRYFKHNQFSSFVRQLNKYSFHKLAPGSYIFGHTYFVKDRADLLLHIGPPRPQDRNGEKGHQTLAGGGAPLSSLQRDATTSKSHLDSAQMSRIASAVSDAFDASSSPLRKTLHSLQTKPGCEKLTPTRHRLPPDRDYEPATSLQCPQALSGKPVCFGSSGYESVITGDTDALEHERPRRSDLDDIVRLTRQRLAPEFSRDLSIEKSERDGLLHRLCAVERRNDDLELELLDCYQRLEALEQCSGQLVGSRRLRVEVKESAQSARKRLRGSPTEDAVSVRSAG